MDALTMDTAHDARVLTHNAFTRLLSWLDDGIDSNGERYLEMRRRLVTYFDRRNRPFADDLADETFNRIARTLETEHIVVRPPARYCYVVARFVLLEDIRRGRRYIPVTERAAAGAVPLETHGDMKERRLACLDRCLDRLRPDQRALAIDYYRDAKRQRIDRRRSIAARLGITMNALTIRASRIRSVLETCVEDCGRQPIDEAFLA
jgi:DNA-directed RNA polymerase specialized sigma24 family protein